MRPAAVAFLLLGACSSLDYDLASVPVPVSAKPAPAGAAVTPLHIERKSVLWVHGLAGASGPDVAALVAEAARGAGGVASFRVRQSAGFHDWLVTHLSLSLIRMKTVVIEGELVGGGR